MNKTTEEKIDYIYNHIKTERKFLYGRRIFKGLMFVFFMGYVYYFYMYGFEKLKNSIIESVKPEINSEKIVEWIKWWWKNILNADFVKNIRNKYLWKKEENEVNNIIWEDY